MKNCVLWPGTDSGGHGSSWWKTICLLCASWPILSGAKIPSGAGRWGLRKKIFVRRAALHWMDVWTGLRRPTATNSFPMQPRPSATLCWMPSLRLKAGSRAAMPMTWCGWTVCGKKISDRFPALLQTPTNRTRSASICEKKPSGRYALPCKNPVPDCAPGCFSGLVLPTIRSTPWRKRHGIFTCRFPAEKSRTRRPCRRCGGTILNIDGTEPQGIPRECRYGGNGDFIYLCQTAEMPGGASQNATHLPAPFVGTYIMVVCQGWHEEFSGKQLSGKGITH